MEKIQFTVEQKEELRFQDFSIVRNLYLPIIGSTSTLLYSLLCDYFYINSKNRSFFALSDLSKTLGISELDLISERKKLEAVGLIRVFENSNGKNYIFSINRPLAPEKFRSNLFLNNALKEKMGDLILERFEFAFKSVDYAKDNYHETTIKYQDIFELKETKEIKEQNTLEIPIPSLKNKEEAITSLTFAQFVFYITGSRISPSQLAILQQLHNSGLSSRSLNIIIDYSYEVNGKIVGNHIKKIGKDFVEKALLGWTSIKKELDIARASKNKYKNRHEQLEIKNESKVAEQDWEELFNSLGGI